MTIRKIFKQTIILGCLVAILVLPFFVFAQAPLEKLENVGQQGGYAQDTDETTVATILGSVVSIFLSLLGIIFLIIVLYAGYNWMTAGGNEEKVEKARKLLTRGVIGLIIIIGSYAIWYFVFDALVSGGGAGGVVEQY
jgi:uncharacterized membrane protein